MLEFIKSTVIDVPSNQGIKNIFIHDIYKAHNAIKTVFQDTALLTHYITRCIIYTAQLRLDG